MIDSLDHRADKTSQRIGVVFRKHLVGGRAGEPGRLFVNTAAHAPNDIHPGLVGPRPPKTGRVILPSRTLVCYVADEPARAASQPAA